MGTEQKKCEKIRINPRSVSCLEKWVNYEVDRKLVEKIMVGSLQVYPIDCDGFKNFLEIIETLGVGVRPIYSMIYGSGICVYPNQYLSKYYGGKK